jgi:hypothetical protein
MDDCFFPSAEECDLFWMDSTVRYVAALVCQAWLILPET